MKEQQRSTPVEGRYWLHLVHSVNRGNPLLDPILSNFEGGDLPSTTTLSEMVKSWIQPGWIS